MLIGMDLLAGRRTWRDLQFCVVEHGAANAWNIYATMTEASLAVFKLAQLGRPADIMDFDELNRRQEAHYMTPLEETDFAKWDEMLNVLPPMGWERADGVERFSIMEFTIGNITQQYAKRNGRYYTRPVNYYDKKTWITGKEIDNFKALDRP